MIDIDALKRDKRPQSAWVVHALIDRLEAAEKELAELRSSMKFRTSLIGRTEAERDALRAKMAEMEQQEPVGKFIQHPSNGIWEQDGYGDNPDARPLYALPGAKAQPAPSVPEDVMRDAERYRYLRARDDGTAGVGCWIEADGRVCDRGWLYGVQLDSAIDSFIEVLAAAPKPEAKP